MWLLAKVVLHYVEKFMLFVFLGSFRSRCRECCALHVGFCRLATASKPHGSAIRVCSWHTEHLDSCCHGRGFRLTSCALQGFLALCEDPRCASGRHTSGHFLPRFWLKAGFATDLNPAFVAEWRGQGGACITFPRCSQRRLRAAEVSQVEFEVGSASEEGACRIALQMMKPDG